MNMATTLTVLKMKCFFQRLCIKCKNFYFLNLKKVYKITEIKDLMAASKLEDGTESQKKEFKTKDLTLPDKNCDYLKPRGEIICVNKMKILTSYIYKLVLTVGTLVIYFSGPNQKIMQDLVFFETKIQILKVDLMTE